MQNEKNTTQALVRKLTWQKLYTFTSTLLRPDCSFNQMFGIWVKRSSVRLVGGFEKKFLTLYNNNFIIFVVVNLVNESGLFYFAWFLHIISDVLENYLYKDDYSMEYYIFLDQCVEMDLVNK